MANIVPQNPDNNRKLWGRIESVVRAFAHKEGELSVVTGPIFQGARLKRLHGRVLVPTHVFKAVHDPERRQAAAYVAPNAPSDAWTVVSIAERRRMTGLDVFPGLPSAMKDTPMALPPPAGPRHPRNEPVR